MKRARAATGAVLAFCVVLAACASEVREPNVAVDPLRFFDGAARSHGTVTTAFVSTEDFTADFEGRRTANELALDERFHFAEGDRLQRWRLAALGEGRYEGTVETQGSDGALHAPVPVAGRTSDGGVELEYDGYAPGGDTLLHFRHRMTGRPDGGIDNRVRVSKFGLPLAGAAVVFEKVPNPAK